MKATLAPHRHAKKGVWEFRLLLAATYPVFLIAAIVRRFLPARRPAIAARAQEGGSVFSEARRLAYSAIPFAFMG